MKQLIAALLMLVGIVAHADTVRVVAENGTTGYYTVCFPIPDIDGKIFETNLTAATSNLQFELMADNESTVTVFAGAADVETIATIGTWVSPTANTDIRFGECDNGTGDFEGMYQIQFHNDHMSKANATEMSMRITDGGTLIMDTWLHFYQNPLTENETRSGSEAAIDAKFAATTGSCDSGTTTTCVDALLTQSDDAWNNFYALEVQFSGQTEVRCIRDFVASSDQLKVNPAFSTAITTENYRILISPECRTLP
jgi:hypothetical protein